MAAAVARVALALLLPLAVPRLVIAVPGTVTYPSAAAQMATAEDKTIGCVLHGYAYPDPAGVPVITNNVHLCHGLCYANALCQAFGFFPATKECFFSNVIGKIHEEPGALSGLKACTSPASACTAVPLPNYLAAHNSAEAFAAWPTLGYQPQASQCWPRNHTAGKLLPCSEVAVIEDMVTTNWPAKCVGLLKRTPEEGQTCKQTCLLDPDCSSWQELVSGECWTGLGKNCFQKPDWDTPPVRSAGRWMRGRRRVLGGLVGVQVMGLLQVFDQANAESTPNPVNSCRNVCLSIRTCTVWQLSNTSGCWVEAFEAERDPSWVSEASDYNGKPLSYPFTGLHLKGGFAADVIAGEYLQRICDRAVPPGGVPGGPTEQVLANGALDVLNGSAGASIAEEELEKSLFGRPWWFWCFIGFLILAVIGIGVGGIYAHCHSQSESVDAEIKRRVSYNQLYQEQQHPMNGQYSPHSIRSLAMGQEMQHPMAQQHHMMQQGQYNPYLQH